MVGWKRHFQLLKNFQFEKKAVFSHNNNNNGFIATFSTYHHLRPSSLLVPDSDAKLNIPHMGPVTRSKSKKLEVGNELLMTKEIAQLIALNSSFTDTSNLGYFEKRNNPIHESTHSLILTGKLPYSQSLPTQPSLNISRPFYQYLQHLQFSGTRNLLADSSDATPIPSPLTPVLAIESGKKVEDQKVVSKPAKVQAVLKGIKQSPKKVNLVAEFVRGMRVEDALLQLQVAVKRAAKTVYQVIHSAKANATHNHGLDADRLLVAEAHVGKGLFKKRINYHAKGKCGMKVRPECRLTVVVREITAKEEAEIAKLKVHNFKKLSKRERRLVPHRLIETTPVWGRKSKGRGTAGMDV